MKVIEFINEFKHRRENGYKIPERIKYNNHFYEYNGSYNNYYQEMSGGNVLLFSFEDLNDEIEIIEEELEVNKKIEKILPSELYGQDYNDVKYIFADRINKIIDKMSWE